MTNSEFLEYVHRINSALATGQLEDVAGEISRAGIAARMHEGLAPDALTEKMRNDLILMLPGTLRGGTERRLSGSCRTRLSPRRRLFKNRMSR